MNNGTRVLSITNQNKSTYEHVEFATEVDEQLSTLKENYYIWLARLLIVFATAALVVFTSSSLVIFRLAPRVTVEPLLILKQYDSSGLTRYEPIEYNMASRKMLMEVFVKQYVIMRNTVVHDYREMQIRWFPGGWVHFLSSDKVFSDFSEDIEKRTSVLVDGRVTTEVEIISIGKQGGENSPVWKVDFKTYEIRPNTIEDAEGENIMLTRYWTASITSYFIPGREMMSRRLMNPLGFTVVRYSQTEVEVL